MTASEGHYTRKDAAVFIMEIPSLAGDLLQTGRDLTDEKG